MWAALPEQFAFDKLQEILAPLGIDLTDAEHREEVVNFLESLRQAGCLVIIGGENPKPTKFTAEEFAKTFFKAPESTNFDYFLKQHGILSSVSLDLTFRCNEKCIHCFNPRHSKPLDSSTDLTTGELVALINEIYDMGVRGVTLTGGECTLRDDLFIILDEIRRLKLSFSISTNGQASEEIYRRLASYYPKAAGISIYSANPEIHDATTRVKGSWEKSIRTLRLLHELDINIQIKSPQMQHSVYGYKELLKLCDELGAVPQFDCTISPATDGSNFMLAHQITDKEALTQLFRERLLTLYVGLDTPTKGQRTTAMDDTLCGAGYMSLSICPDGTVFPCNSLPITLGNIRNGGLRKIWEESEALKAWNALCALDTDECGLYHKCSYCNYCPGVMMLTNNDILGTQKTICELAELRLNIIADLQNGIDPLNEYKRKYGQPFGYDLTYREPVSSENCSATNKVVDVDKNGDHFAAMVKSIKKNGNPKRSKNYEQGSPMDLYVRGERRVEPSEDTRFAETGR